MHMKMIQIRNVPDPLHRELKARAARAGMSLSDYLLDFVRKAAERPEPDELRRRVRERSPVYPTESPADAVRAERGSA
jgi:antitoxin FitA